MSALKKINKYQKKTAIKRCKYILDRVSDSVYNKEYMDEAKSAFTKCTDSREVDHIIEEAIRLNAAVRKGDRFDYDRHNNIFYLIDFIKRM